MLTYSSYGARNRHLGGPTTDAGETPSPLEKLLLKQEKTPSDHKLRGRTCWNLHLLHGNRTNSGPGFPSGPWNGLFPRPTGPPAGARRGAARARAGCAFTGASGWRPIESAPARRTR